MTGQVQAPTVDWGWIEGSLDRKVQLKQEGIRGVRDQVTTGHGLSTVRDRFALLGTAALAP